ncbi:hypothetical protein D9619_004594 [Psilocybe cf. subviscida]|uniref:Fatty acid synthase meander beta sheet domain-containing protein n=1 Tax=Psilocybe cf. subviscida TaxID=2480587 RepID=A0A8H5BT45_9AGAR|nr:hypothetical protein D9619_004594 [Psilocybe cf. subviscida]
MPRTSNIMHQQPSQRLCGILVPHAGQMVADKYNGVAPYPSAPPAPLTEPALRSFSEQFGSTISLSLLFGQGSQPGFTPIHEIATGCYQHIIKKFYGKIWYGEQEVFPPVDIYDKSAPSHHPGRACQALLFCRRQPGRVDCDVEDQGGGDVYVFTVVTGWQLIPYSMFSSDVDGDTLNACPPLEVRTGSA